MRGCILMALAVSPLAAGLLAAAGDAKGDPVGTEMKRLAGTWRPVSGLIGGKEVPAERLRAMTFALDAQGKWTFREGGEVEEGTFRIDPTKRPKTADFQISGGTLKGQAALAIYELKGDTLRVCYVIGRKDKLPERPTEFASPPGRAIVLGILKRVKAK
jgi:uncharacterized protein (TIGR03067 family)